MDERAMEGSGAARIGHGAAPLMSRWLKKPISRWSTPSVSRSSGGSLQHDRVLVGHGHRVGVAKLARAEDDVLLAGQPLQADGAARMDTADADADGRPQAELLPLVLPRRGVDQDGAGIRLP